MFCPKCGHENPGGSAFCGWCGRQLTGVLPIRPYPEDQTPRTAPSRPYRAKTLGAERRRETARPRPARGNLGGRTRQPGTGRGGLAVGLLVIAIGLGLGIAQSASKHRQASPPQPTSYGGDFNYAPPRDYSTYGQDATGPYAGGQQRDPFGMPRMPTVPTPSPYTPPTPRRPLIPGQAQPTDSNYLTGGVRTVPTPRPSNPQPGGVYGGYSPGSGYGGTTGGHSPGGSPYTGSYGVPDSSSNP